MSESRRVAKRAPYYSCGCRLNLVFSHSPFRVGKATEINEGNKRFRKLVADRAPAYADRNQQCCRQLAEEIIEIIHAKGGRFLKRVDEDAEAQCSSAMVPGYQQWGHHRGERWEVVEGPSVKAKVLQALRDAVSKQRGGQRKRMTAARLNNGMSTCTIPQMVRTGSPRDPLSQTPLSQVPEGLRDLLLAYELRGLDNGARIRMAEQRARTIAGGLPSPGETVVGALLAPSLIGKRASLENILAHHAQAQRLFDEQKRIQNHGLKRNGE